VRFRWRCELDRKEIIPRERWPWWRAPIVATKPTVFPWSNACFRHERYDFTVVKIGIDESGKDIFTWSPNTTLISHTYIPPRCAQSNSTRKFMIRKINTYSEKYITLKKCSSRNIHHSRPIIQRDLANCAARVPSGGS
jgi:hypothetical protein